jgi:hypothetical protein
MPGRFGRRRVARRWPQAERFGVVRSPMARAFLQRRLPAALRKMMPSLFFSRLRAMFQ